MNGRPWTDADDDTLRDALGVVPRAQLARQLDRTETAVIVRAKRLGVCQRQAFLTLREVGRLCGVDSKTVYGWVWRGLLRARRSVVVMGRHRLWHVEVEDFATFLRDHPGWYHPERVTEAPWASIVRQAQAADPLLTAAEAARLLGVSVATVRRHLRRGWLAGERAENSGNLGTWLVRRSALAAFAPRNPATVGRVALRSVAGQNGRRGKRQLSRTPLAAVPATIARPQPARVERQTVRYQPVDWRAS